MSQLIDGCGRTINYPLLESSLQIVRDHPLLRSLEDEQFDCLSKSVRLHELVNGDTLFLQDSTADRFFLIIQGVVKLYSVTSDGREGVLNVLGEMDSVGEVEMFLDKPGFSVNVAAVDKTRLISFNSRLYKELLRASNKSCFDVIVEMACRLQQGWSEIEALTQQSASHRVIRFLLSQIAESDRKKDRVVIRLPIAKGLIAARLAMQPETFSRIICDFRQQGLMEVSGSELSINRLADLRQMI